jgi:hypothetical protein
MMPLDPHPGQPFDAPVGHPGDPRGRACLGGVPGREEVAA